MNRGGDEFVVQKYQQSNRGTATEVAHDPG